MWICMQSSCAYFYFFINLIFCFRLSCFIIVFRFSVNILMFMKSYDETVHALHFLSCLWNEKPWVILAANKSSESPSKLPEKLPDNMRLFKAFWSDQRCCWCIALSNAAPWCPKCHLKDKKAINLCKNDEQDVSLRPAAFVTCQFPGLATGYQLFRI